MKRLCLQMLGFCSLFLVNPIKCRVIHKRSDLRIIPPPSEVPTIPPSWQGGCFYEGTWYPLDSDISSEKQEGSCSGLHCDSAGNVLSWDTPDCTLAPPPPPMTTPPRRGCFYEGKWYDLNTDISRGSDGLGWCYGLYCGANGNLMVWDDWNCHPTKTTEETTMPPTTTPPITLPYTTFPTRPYRGCFHEGAWYAPDTDISQGSDGYGWCYGTYCDADGHVAAWDNFNCLPTMPPPTTEETTMPPPTQETTMPPPTTQETTMLPTTTEETTMPPPPTQETTMPSPTTQETTMLPTTTPPPTTLPDTMVPMLHQGCFHDGKWYAPNSDISRGSDGRGWCYGQYCGANGNLIAWDDWNCQPTKTTEETTMPHLPLTTPPPKTEEKTTEEEKTTIPASPTTTHVVMATNQQGCFNAGIWYPLNSQISFTKSGEMCFGFLCDHAGNIVSKLCFNCGDSLDCPEP